MPTVLDQIVAATRRTLAERMSGADLGKLERNAAQHSPRGLRAALQRASEAGIAIIAELKKASPSKGLIRADFDAALLARELEAGGAAALSVLTDEPFFQGSLENLRLAAANSSLPCLRKDFILHEFQMLEARAHGADAVLLIVAALSQAELLSLVRHARAMGLEVLCEAHDERELGRALDAGCDVAGINTRDLLTFQVNLETAFQLASRFPAGVVRVAESGIRNADDIAKLRVAGYHAFLIGESLMTSASPGESLKSLIEGAAKAVQIASL